MSARAIFDHHGVAYTAVEQTGAGANEDLRDWTRHRNAPVAVFNDEPPRTGWLDILNLAERLGAGPSLIPTERDTRMAMIGHINELIGEHGLIWQMRLLMLGLGGPERAAKEAARNPMYADYGYTETARDEAPARIAGILDRFTRHAAGQQKRGSPYLFGDRLSAADLYWAYFSLIFATLPDALCPMPEPLRKSYDYSSAAIGGCAELLINQRDFIFEQHLELPMTF